MCVCACVGTCSPPGPSSPEVNLQMAWLVQIVSIVPHPY